VHGMHGVRGSNPLSSTNKYELKIYKRNI